MSQYRTPTAYVLGVLVLLAVIVLTTPNGGTHARWSATAQSEVPAMATGRVGFEVGGAEGGASSATLTNTSGFGVEYRPRQVSLTGSDGETVTPPPGLRFAYRTGADCGTAGTPARWTAVAAGGSARVAVLERTAAPLERDRPAALCLTVSTDGVPEDELRPLAGRQLQVLTELEATSLGEGTWSTTRSWTAPFTVEPPEAAPPAETPAVPAATCTPGLEGVLSWPWSATTDGARVVGWELLRRPQLTGGDWTVLRSVPESPDRAVTVTAADVPNGGAGKHNTVHEFAVRAHFAPGTAAPETLPIVWALKSPGESRKIECMGVRQ
ncbi:hypothetical protein [Kocuria sp. CH-021]|uniref:hypothetical protein n=1 Tax=Kocuria sp. CH-021 TaxID=3406735 RepID=UPI003C750A4E